MSATANRAVAPLGSVSFEYFDALYRELTGHDGAFRWQYRLFCDFAAGYFPTDIELPTGIGKTSIIVVWLMALAHALKRGARHVPRRLVYVVDRRVVVDQASEFAEEICNRLEEAVRDDKHALHSLAKALQGAGYTPSVVELSTLRGQRALDTSWRDDPTRSRNYCGDGRHDRLALAVQRLRSLGSMGPGARGRASGPGLSRCCG